LQFVGFLQFNASPAALNLFSTFKNTKIRRKLSAEKQIDLYFF